MKKSYAPYSLRGILWVFAMCLGPDLAQAHPGHVHSAARIVAAAKIYSEIKINRDNAKNFIVLGKFERQSVLCIAPKPSNPQVGLKIKVGRKTLLWRSFGKLISMTKNDRRLNTAQRIRRVRQLSAAQVKFLSVCTEKLDTQATPTASPTAPPTTTPTIVSSPSPSPSLSPSPSTSPSITASPSHSPTVSPTPSPSVSASPSPSVSPAVSPSPSPTHTPLAILIDCGGGPTPYLDSHGENWMPDTYFTQTGIGGSFKVANPIGQTEDDALYQSQRWGDFSYSIPVPPGVYDITLHFAELYQPAAGVREFNVTVEGQSLNSSPIDISGESGGTFSALTKSIEVGVVDGTLNITFEKIGPEWSAVNAIEIREHHHEGDAFLHVVMDVPDYQVDYDNDLSENVNLIGHSSHTHQPATQLNSYVWKEGNTVLGNVDDIATQFGIGSHAVSLTIGDTNVPSHYLTGSKTINIFAANQVGGVLAKYYNLQSGSLSALIDALPTFADFIEYRPDMSISAQGTQIGGSSFETNTVVVMGGTLKNLAAGNYQFLVPGLPLYRIFVDGTLVAGSRALGAGNHSVEVRFGVTSSGFLPAALTFSKDDGPAQNITLGLVSHDESALAAFINTMPAMGSFQGGENFTISGLGFFPPQSVRLHWGNTVLQTPQIAVSPNSISLVSPPGAIGQQISVWIEIQGAPARSSNIKQFTYTGTVPVSFGSKIIDSSVSQFYTQPLDPGPTAIDWGPDGRLYVGTTGGEIVIYTLDDNLDVVSQPITIMPLLPDRPYDSILGLTFNPLDDPNGPIKVYIGHAPLFAQGGACVDQNSQVDYRGQVTVVSIDPATYNVIQAVPLITNLSVSNHDHGVNAMTFDNYGDLYVSVGGNTNAGVRDWVLGDLPETPLAGAILKAQTSNVNFNGALNYRRTDNNSLDNNQLHGEEVYLASGSDVSVFGAGLRNCLDIVWTTTGKIFSVTNGPNQVLGQKAYSATNPQPPACNGVGSVENPNDFDRFDFIAEGHFYGHANRSRGQFDDRQNVFRWRNDPPRLGDYTPPLTLVNLVPSTNGIDEYRSARFNNQLRGNLILQRFPYQNLGDIYSAALSSNGSVTLTNIIPSTESGLGIQVTPGGSLIAGDYWNNRLRVYMPQDQVASDMKAFDITPWRAVASGGSKFVIGGQNFGSSTANIAVTIGGAAVQITSVSPNRIRGIIPAKINPSSAMLDLVVTRSDTAESSTVSQAFRYVFKPGAGFGTWAGAPALPSALSEVAGGIINGVLYLVGGERAAPYAYDFVFEKWFSVTAPNGNTTLANRPSVGDRHTAEVINGKLYVIGGIAGINTTLNKLQVFDPNANTWTYGPDLPFSTGAASSAVINGKIYVAGGVVGSANPNTINTAVYDPAANNWSVLAPMPHLVNHAAAGTDGTKFYVFGGRDGDNVPSAGFNYVQIYDPSTNTWTRSDDGVSGIPPLPQRRGGMGKAVFFNGELYVMGGETSVVAEADSPGNVFARVDVYNPKTKTWRLDTPMRIPRHGIFPMAYNGRIYIAGGSTQAGSSPTNAMDDLRR